MIRTLKATAVAALCCTVAGTGLVACEETLDPDAKPKPAASSGKPSEGLFSGTGKIRAGGRSVNVSCSGGAGDGGPVVVLLPGGGDGLDKTAALQKTLSKKNRVCSYDRLGEGGSDKPEGPQQLADVAEVLTAVLDRVAGDAPVVLAGHSLGGWVAARYAPNHQDRVKGLVLMDATIPNLTAGISKVIPESETGPASRMRDEAIAANQGKNAEKLVMPDGKVRSAGDIPVEILKHETQYASVPEYGPALERMWSDGQREWLGLSGRAKLATAGKSGHYIYVDRPDLAVEAVERVTAQVADRQP